MSRAEETDFIDRKGHKEGRNKDQKANWSLQSYFPCEAGGQTEQQNSANIRLL
jgi:hypothetical protein